MFDLKSYLAEVRGVVNDRLRRDLGGSAPETRILQSMAYSVMAGGKRLRPILCIAAAESVGLTFCPLHAPWKCCTPTR